MKNYKGTIPLPTHNPQNNTQYPKSTTTSLLHTTTWYVNKHVPITRL